MKAISNKLKLISGVACFPQLIPYGPSVDTSFCRLRHFLLNEGSRKMKTTIKRIYLTDYGEGNNIISESDADSLADEAMRILDNDDYAEDAVAIMAKDLGYDLEDRQLELNTILADRAVNAAWESLFGNSPQPEYMAVNWE